MSAEQLVQRLLAMETGVNSHRLRQGYIDDEEWDRVSRAFGKLAEAKIYIDDTRRPVDSPTCARAPAGCRRAGARPANHRLPATDAGRRTDNRVQEIRDLARPEGAGPRVERAGRRALPALARRGSAN